jgi:hypothetical protein
MTVHGSPVNTSDRRRLGLAVNFVTPNLTMNKMLYGDEHTKRVND